MCLVYFVNIVNENIVNIFMLSVIIIALETMKIELPSLHYRTSTNRSLVLVARRAKSRAAIATGCLVVAIMYSGKFYTRH